MAEVFAAPRTYSDDEIYEGGVGDSRGFIDDGAYVARVPMGPTIPDSAKTLIDPQEAYTRALKARFLVQRKQLHSRPGAESVAALNRDHPTALSHRDYLAYRNWHRLLYIHAPLPAQLRTMDTESVFRVLQLMQKHFLVREHEIPRNISAWIWSLLARLDDVGTMDNDQVFIVREFGKKAVLVQVSFDNPEGAEELDQPDDTDEEVDDEEALADQSDAGAEAPTTSGNDADMKKKEQREQTGDSDEDSHTMRQNTLATLDSIIVIVGEIFGQRDLLEFRNSWSPQE
jgi:hypothetical protein